MLVAAVLAVAFADKAFTIDDSFFLSQARQLLREPLNPSGFDMAWDNSFGRASRLAPTGPGMAYLLWPTAALGGVEWVAHLTVWACLAIGAVALSALCLAWGGSVADARLVSLMLVTTPAVLGMAGTAMPDVPAMSLALVGVERLVSFTRRGDPWRAVWGGACLGAAVLLRSHAVMLVPVAARLLAGPSSWAWPPVAIARRLWPLGVTALVVAGVAWLTRDPETQHASLMSAPLWIHWRHIPKNLVAFFAHFLFALPLALVWLSVRGRRAWVWLFAAGVPLAYLGLWSWNHHRWWWAAPMAALGLTVMVDVWRWAWASRDLVRTTLAMWLLAALPVCIYLHLAIKYTIISAPAVVMVVILATRNASVRRRRLLRGAWVAGGLLLGIAILRADAQLADLGRRAAAELVAPRVAAGQRVYYSGHWGFQWYAEAAGARALLSRHPRLRAGDVIVFSSSREGRLPPRQRRLVQRLRDESGAGGRVMQHDAGAGFFSNNWGYLPWSWGAEPIDEYEVWQIVGD
jgi:4-amino-4-deoxy-L-arabinose transferase-like glycosyltransferase